MATYLIRELLLEGERPMSWNTLYEQTHWGKRKEEADRVHWLVKLETKNQGLDKVAIGPVDITVTAFFDKRPLDADNICAKMYIDGLIGWAIENDSYKYVKSVKTVTCIDRDNPRMVIEISEEVRE